MPDGTDIARHVALGALGVAAALSLTSLVPWSPAEVTLPESDTRVVVQAWDPLRIPVAGLPRDAVDIARPWEPLRLDAPAVVVTRPGQRAPRGAEPIAVESTGIHDGLAAYAVAPPPREDDPERPPEPPQRSLASLLPMSEVAIVHPDGTRRVCTRWRFDRWECGPEPWIYVGPTEVTVRDRQETCLWAHPTAEGTLEITLPPLPPASRITGQSALSDTGVDNPEPGEIRLTLSRDGEELGVHRQPQRNGMRSFRFRITDPEPPAPAEPVEDVVEGSGEGAPEGVGTAPLQIAPNLVPSVPTLAPTHLLPQPTLADGSGAAADDHTDDTSDDTDLADPASAPEPPAEDTPAPLERYTLSVDADTVAQRHFCLRGQVHFGPRTTRRPRADRRRDSREDRDARERDEERLEDDDE